MKFKLGLWRRMFLTILFTLAVWSHIIWDHFHGGIPVHYVLHNPDLPGIPNWLGGIIFPFFTWYLLYRIQKRINKPDLTVTAEHFKKIILRFFASFCVSVLIAICFVNGFDAIDFIMGTLFLLAFIFPLYKSEYLLGWVLGSVFTFGAILPMVFGSILAGLFFIFYEIPRKVLPYFISKRK